MRNYIVKMELYSKPVIEGCPPEPEPDFLRSAVGGDTDRVAVTAALEEAVPGLIMIANSRGGELKLPTNAIATAICFWPEDTIKGTAILLRESPGAEERYRPLTYAEAEAVARILADIIEGGEDA